MKVSLKCQLICQYWIDTEKTRFLMVSSERLVTAWKRLTVLHNTLYFKINPLTSNDLYMSRTAPPTSKHCILYIYSTNAGTEYFKHALYCPFFLSSKCSLFHSANLFGFCIIHILHTGCLEIKKKNNSGPKGLST